MAYCRWSESDFYVYATERDGIWIHGPQEDREGLTQREALAYLEEQRAAGRSVPEHALERLRREIDQAERIFETNMLDFIN